MIPLIRLRLGVVVLPCNHPYRVVECVSTLDVVSEGRVEFGTGRGASPYHTEAFGYAASKSKAVWEESLRIILLGEKVIPKFTAPTTATQTGAAASGS
jgi:alkanesulfonate monooxygenase SsuD/methylene tetrahydromethanopterin reductase-like flavin-dependent oxidoreductase (luciferase family)